MNTTKTILFYIVLCTSAAVLGSLLYFRGKEWIIIRWPSYVATPLAHNEIHVETTKKKVRLSFWHYHRWNYETIDILWSNNIAENIQYLIRSLLTLLEEEQVLEKKASLQSATQSLSGNNVYLSFDRTPFNEEAPTFDKLMIIESILKTVRENGITIPNIYFLVHHQPMKDVHLDFSLAWPLEGFITAHKQQE